MKTQYKLPFNFENQYQIGDFIEVEEFDGIPSSINIIDKNGVIIPQEKMSIDNKEKIKKIFALYRNGRLYFL